MKTPNYTTIDDLFLDNSSLGFAIHEEETGNLISLNKEFARIYELEGQNIKNVNQFLEYVYQRDPFAKDYVQKLASETDINKQVWQEFPVRLPSGRKKFIDARNLKNKHEKVIYSIAEDVTQKVKIKKVNELTLSLLTSLNSGKEKELMYNYMANFIHDTFDVYNFYIAILNDKKDFIHFEFFRDEQDSEIDDRPLSNGITEYFLNKNKTELLDKKDINNLIDRGIMAHVGSLPEQFLGSILQINNEPIGVIGIQSYTNKNALHEEDLASFHTLSQEISTIIQTEKYVSDVKEMNAFLDDYVVNMLHDIKNRLYSASSALDLLKNQEDLEAEEKRYLFTSIGKAINELIMSAEEKILSSKNIKKENVLLDLSEIVQNSIGEFTNHYEEKNIDIISNIAPAKINYVESYVLFSVRNLISNAIKFTDENKNIYINVSSTEDYVVFNIKDEGKGMNESQVQQAILGNIKSSGKTNGGGTGVGINGMIKFLDEYETPFELKSEVGKGTEWKIYFRNED